MFVFPYQACYYEAMCLFEISLECPWMKANYLNWDDLIIVHMSSLFQVTHIQNIFQTNMKSKHSKFCKIVYTCVPHMVKTA